jgi:rhodanese-related sulfurtransferase
MSLKPICFTFIVLLACALTYSQNNSIGYKTVYLEDLCRDLESNKDIILLDVRSKGEFDDTSHVLHLNLGRFKKAINVDIAAIEDRLDELKKYKDKDIYVYCSHSNRSRVVSQFLTDSGFTKVTNINGGISTFVHDGLDCGLYENSLPYKLYPPAAVRNIMAEGNIMVIDIRPREEYESRSDKEIRNAGRIKGTVNIPADELEGRLGEIDKDRKVILIDFDITLSPKAASMLVSKGYSDVGIMTFGIASWVLDFNSTDNMLENTPQYRNLNPSEVCTKLPGSDMLILDVRTETDFKGKNEMEHMNIGRLKNALNIPRADIEKRLGELEIYKDKEILVYEFGREGKASETAKILTQKGFKNVSVLFSGLYGITWRQKNIKNFCVPAEYIVH